MQRDVYGFGLCCWRYIMTRAARSNALVFRCVVVAASGMSGGYVVELRACAVACGQQLGVSWQAYHGWPSACCIFIMR